MALVNPMSLCSPGIVACTRNDNKTAGMKMIRKRKIWPSKGILAMSFIHSISVLTASNNRDIYRLSSGFRWFARLIKREVLL